MTYRSVLLRRTYERTEIEYEASDQAAALREAVRQARAGGKYLAGWQPVGAPEVSISDGPKEVVK
jgi:hypothetical protein